jgi:hypothetical protein
MEKIRHLPPRLLHGEELVHLAKQGKVRPQDAAEEAYAVDDNLVIVEDMYVVPGLSGYRISAQRRPSIPTPISPARITTSASVTGGSKSSNSMRRSLRM